MRQDRWDKAGGTKQDNQARMLTGRTKTRREKLQSLEMITGKQTKKEKIPTMELHFDLKAESIANLSIFQQPKVIRNKFCPLQLQGQHVLSLNCSTAPGQRQLLDPH